MAADGAVEALAGSPMEPLLEAMTETKDRATVQHCSFRFSKVSLPPGPAVRLVRLLAPDAAMAVRSASWSGAFGRRRHVAEVCPVAHGRELRHCCKMRVKTPAPFTMAMTGREGAYDPHFVPHDDWDGEIAVVISGHAMVWQVLSVDFEDGQSSLSGTTQGSESVWPTQFWFRLTPDHIQSRI